MNPLLLPRLAAAALIAATLACWQPPACAQDPAHPLATLVEGHPRLLANKADFDALKAQITKDKRLAGWFNSVHRSADKILKEPVSEYVIPDGKRLLATSRTVKNRILTLGLVYRVTSDKAYLDRAWQELDAAAHFKDWNPSHFLDTAEMTNAFALGYDWFFDGWNPEQRAFIKKSIVQKGLNPALTVYREHGWWTAAHHNWNQVCNGGIGTGALAIADEEPALASEILSSAITSLPLAMKEFAPDGAWLEGPGYWAYATEYNVMFLAALQSALGTDFGLCKTPGFSKTADFPQYFTGPFGMTFNYADGKGPYKGAPQVFWLARIFGNTQAAAMQLRYADNSYSPLNVLWGAWWLAHPPKPASLPLARKFGRVEMASMRSDWNDPKAAFVGFKGGTNTANHGHLDLGSFVFDVLGQRWAIDPGADDYNLPGYFGDKRWTYFRLRAEAHNTLVIDPANGPDQSPSAKADIVQFSDKPGHAFAIVDLSSAAPGSSHKRGIALTGRQLLIQDEVRTKKPAELWWFMQTPAQVTLQGDHAVLSQGGEKVSLHILSPSNARFEVQSAGPLPSSPNPARQNQKTADYPDTKRLAIHLSGVSETRIVVTIVPGGETGPSKVEPLSAWR